MDRLLQGLYLYVALSIGIFMGFVGTYNYFPRQELVPVTRTVTRTESVTSTAVALRVTVTETTTTTAYGYSLLRPQGAENG